MKFRHAALLVPALLLSGCAEEVHGEYYRPEPVSVTVSLTEPEPEPEPIVTQQYDIGAFLPICNKYKENAELEDKFRPYLENIILGDALLYYSEMFPDDIPYGEELSYPNEWAMLDKSFAESKEQLLLFYDKIYTDDYRDSLYSYSFEEGLFGVNAEDGSDPRFKEENGALYRHIYWGGKGMKFYKTDGFRVRKHDDDTAELGVCYSDGYGYGYEVFYLKYSAGRGWRLDSKGADYNARTFGIGNGFQFGAVPSIETAELMEYYYGEVTGPEFVFTYFNETLDTEYIESNGEKYYRTKNYYPVEKMRAAFERYISEYEWAWSDEAEDFVQTDKPLLQPCIEKYIDEVYIESEGKLYRRDGAPVYEIDGLGYPEGCKDILSADVTTPRQYVEIRTSGSRDKILFVAVPDEDGRRNEAKLANELPLRIKN